MKWVVIVNTRLFRVLDVLIHTCYVQGIRGVLLRLLHIDRGHTLIVDKVVLKQRCLNVLLTRCTLNGQCHILQKPLVLVQSLSVRLEFKSQLF